MSAAVLGSNLPGVRALPLAAQVGEPGDTARTSRAGADPLVDVLAEIVRGVESRRGSARGHAETGSSSFGAVPGDLPSVPPAAPASVPPAAPAPESEALPLVDALPPELSALLAQASGDPLLALSLISSAIESSRIEGQVQDVASARQTSENAALERERAIDEAIRSASRRSRMPKWLKKVLKAVAVVASLVASAFTGGALAAVAAAGIVLALAAPQIGELAVELGMDPKNAKWLVVGLQAVGGAMSMAAGGAGASAGAAGGAQVMQRAAQLTSSIVGAASDVLAGSEQIAQSVFLFRAAEARGDADLAGVLSDEANGELDEAVRILGDGMRALGRSIEAREELLSLRSEATRAILSRTV